VRPLGGWLQYGYRWSRCFNLSAERDLPQSLQLVERHNVCENQSTVCSLWEGASKMFVVRKSVIRIRYGFTCLATRSWPPEFRNYYPAWWSRCFLSSDSPKSWLHLHLISSIFSLTCWKDGLHCLFSVPCPLCSWMNAKSRQREERIASTDACESIGRRRHAFVRRCIDHL